jgi:pimeloyl-ACP methyl ester carboxylesterase
VAVRETALLFGADKGLVGVITDPAPAVRTAPRPGVVLLNAGFLHRVGPNRLYVKLARRLAASGFTVLRFDLSGIGDSRPARETLGFEERALLETRAAFDLLASTRGLERFAVGGLCSGADNALQAARADDRVVGLALLEPLSGVPTAGQVLGSYRDRLRSPRSWLRLFTGRSELWGELPRLLAARLARRRARRSTSAASPAADALAPGTRPEAAPPSPAGQMRGFVERGGALCLVYSAHNPAHYHYERALAPELRGLGEPGLRVLVVEETDHVFTPLEAQRRVVETLADWAETLDPDQGRPRAS